MRANKKVIAIIVVTLVLAIAAVTGVVMYLNDDGTARAGFDGNEPSISAGDNTNVGTEDNNNEDEPNQNPEEPSEETPGDLPVAGEDEENQSGTTGTAGTTGTGTTTNEEDVPNEEYVTERIETVERQISEDLLVGWTPLQINSTYSTTGLGIYKPELSILKVSATSDENNSVSAGDILTYVLAVMNTGSEDANGINISDIIPEQTTLIEESIYGEGTYNVELNKLTWKVNVKAGEVVTVGFAVIVNDNAKGTIKNAGTINGEETQEVLNPVIESSKISELYRNGELIEGVANIGDQIKYTITVQNTGDVTATANVQDTIPANTKLVSSIVLAGEEIDEETMVNGKDVEIPAGEKVTLTFTVEIEAIDGAIENVATVGDTTPSDEVETANLEIAKTVSTTGEEGTYGENVTLKVGETAYFKIELKNTGSEELQLNVSDLMGETALDLYDGAEKVTELFTIAAGETKVLTATYTMLQSDIDNQTVLVNKVTVTEQDNKVPADEDTATITPEEKAPSIFVEKTTVSVTPADTAEPQEVTDNTKVRPNDVITYSIYVKNDGNVTLHNVKVTDLLDVKYEGTLVEAAKGQVLDTIVSLAPGEDKTYTVEYTVTQPDIDKGEPIINTAIATDGTTTGEDDTDEEIPINPDVTVSGDKTWVDYNNQENTRPEKITVEVLNGNEVVDTIEVTAATNWEYTSRALPKYDANNNVITYTVREQTVPDYTATVSGYDITNKLTVDPTVTVSGEKTWVDYNNQENTRPQKITVEVLNGDKVVDTIEVTAATNWEYTSKALPKYDANNNVITYTVREQTVPDYTATVSGYDITNTLTVEPTVTVSGDKTWVDYNNQENTRPQKITVEVLNGNEVVDTIEVTAATNWEYTSKALPKYDADNNVITYTVREQTVPDYTTTVSGYDITNTLTVEPTVTVSGEKTWIDYNNQENTRPEKITVEVLNGNEVVDTIEVTAATNWEYTSKALPKYDANNNVITYTVREQTVPDYTATVSGYDITNTLTVEPTVTVSGEKTWVDYNNQENTRPEKITVEVLDGDKVVDTIEVTAATNWEYTSKALPKYDANNNVITYTVREQTVPDYTATVSGYDITNTLTVEPTVTVSGEKTWVDYNNQENTRPEKITVEVLDGDKVVDTIEVTAATNWEYTSKALPKYDANNNVITYTVREQTVPDYTATVSGYDITNTLTVEPTVTVSGEKTWVDYNNQENTRPEKITVEVLDGDKVVDTIEVTAATNWEYTSRALPKYDADNNVITYTVREQTVADYTTTVSGYDITNTLTVEPTVTVSGDKTWVDYNNQENTRPEKITVEVLNGDKVVDTIEVTAATNWEYTSRALPKYDANNNVITYTVREQTVPDYTTTVSGYDITNTLTEVPTVTVSGDKIWVDYNNQESTRPASIIVEVLNGSEVVDTIEVTAATNWEYTSKALPKYDANNNVITYTVREQTVPDYTTTVSGYDITNTLTVEATVTVSGDKTWVDYNNQENTRPEKITVEVLNGNEVVDTIEVTAATNWEYTSKALPKYDANNNVITYTVREQTVEGYTATVSGYDITNTLTVEPTVSLVGEKIWNDVNNQDGVRPDNITIVLVSSDENDLTERLVTIGKKADGTYDWTYEFTGLPKYDANNNVISYYVTETGIDTNDYTSVPSNVTTDSNGNFVANITNVHVTEKVTISGTKTWNDANNQDGYRPNSITVKLMNGDTQVAETTAQAPDWTYSFANMDRKANGEVINYTVVEEMSSNANKYTADYTDRTVATNGDITANITNTHTPETVTISGTKTWVGDNSAQRPASIIVKLMNGSTEVTRVTVTPDANGDWKYTFPAQPKFANGNEINYSVEEVSIEGYTSKVTGYNIENTFVKPELTKVKTSTAGEKVNLGDEITYTITTKNTGKTVANSVVITDTVPQYTTLKNGTISDNGTVSGTTITWNVGDLAVGESKSVSFTVTVNSTADVIGEKITNTGYVNGDPTNPVETTVKKDILVSKKEYPVKSIDVVLVLDISSSMNEYSRLRNAKSAACDFIDEMFPAGTSGTGSTVTVVTFNDTATTLGNATSSSTAASLKNKINNISIPEGKGTNIQAALVQTNSVLDSLKNKNKFVVFLGDGAPTPEFIIYGYDEHRKHYEKYVESDYPNNTEAKITAQANNVKAKTTGVYTIGFGMDKLSTSREYWSHYIECTKSNCRDSNHITVNAGDKNRGKSYHWESAKVYATRILKDIIADSATAEKQYYYTADDSVESIVSQFMQVLQSISTTDKTIKAESATVKIPVEGTLNTDKNIIIKIGNTSHECKVSQLPQYGVSYTKTATEEYFTWNISNYVTSKLSIEYTIK